MTNIAKQVTALLALTTAITLSSCSASKSDTTSSAPTSNEAYNSLKQELETLKAENAKLKEQLAAKASTEGTSVTSEEKAPVQEFSDITGCFGEKEIKTLVKLKVIAVDAPVFEPTKPITRAQFVDWLVKANNAIRPAKYFIRTAEKDASSSFSDLSSKHPDFPAIQGMSNAGWSVGFMDKTFKPEEALTREQLIAIKAPLDYQQAGLSNYLEKWQDNSKISKNCKEPMNLEAFSGHNWERVFGKTKNCDPQKTVTRAEAAVCVYQLQGGSNAYTGADPQGGQ